MWRQCSYTVSENTGSVEVCVNLTRPQFDFLGDEFVVVEVYDYHSSVYIPANASLASEPLSVNYVVERSCTQRNQRDVFPMPSIINPRHACAGRVTVLGLVCTCACQSVSQSVCLSV